jgi:hypothetical protein
MGDGCFICGEKHKYHKRRKNKSVLTYKVFNNLIINISLLTKSKCDVCYFVHHKSHFVYTGVEPGRRLTASSVAEL